MDERLNPILPLLEDPEVTELLIDGWQKVYIEKHGKLDDVPSPFKSDDEVYALIDAIMTPMGQVVNESSPIADARLQDGSLVNVVIPPIALTGPTVTIRKAAKQGEITPEKLVEWESVSQDMLDFLRACVLSRVNIVVAGGTASGKTTILNVLARWIPDDERIIVMQKDLFTLPQRRVVVLETRPANIEGRGEISMTQLVNNALRMRPDRIVMTEADGGEAYYMLNAMASGYDGGMFSVHATSVRDALVRLEMMSGYANPSFPLLSLREKIAFAVDVIVYQERMSDGRRRIVKIAEVTGVQDGIVTTRDLFEFRRTGTRGDKIYGVFTATGAIPYFVEPLQKVSNLPISVFTPA